jgi:hypothetical protein
MREPVTTTSSGSFAADAAGQQTSIVAWATQTLAVADKRRVLQRSIFVLSMIRPPLVKVGT